MNRLVRNLSLLLGAAGVLALGGCQLVVGFDRDLITDGGDAGDMDGGDDAGPGDAGPGDAGPGCGNSMLDMGEGCDDGNTTAGDGCDDACELEAGWNCDTAGMPCTEICGDGMMVGSEACDDGFTDACGTCNADCTAAGTAPVCGDSEICEELEECDDGNTTAMPEDGCDDACAIQNGWVCNGAPSVCAETCGNSMVETGEMCDDGNTVDDDGCTNCQIDTGWSCMEPGGMGTVSVCDTVCGDMIIVMGEETCDDGNTAAMDGCDATCQEEAGWTCINMPSVCSEDCGDGMMVGMEFCDDGFTTACGACNANCSAAGSGSTCGDGTTCTDTEMCDDGFTDACGTCNATCTAAGGGSTCGDGTRCPETEMCDDGFTDACGTCNATCTAAGGGSSCGDGTTCPETEMCDDGFTTACGVCNATCTAAGSGGTCGDGTVCSDTETCDDGNANACGTCDATCSAVLMPAVATGSIDAVAAMNLVEGETFTIGDGSTSVTFEVDLDGSGGLGAGNVDAGVRTGDNANAAATAIDGAIGGTALALTTSVTTNTISLTNPVGAAGNVTITETVADAGFVVAGLSGGVGAFCPATTGCTGDAVCVSTCNGGTSTCD